MQKEDDEDYSHDTPLEVAHPVIDAALHHLDVVPHLLFAVTQTAVELRHQVAPVVEVALQIATK